MVHQVLTVFTCTPGLVVSVFVAIILGNEMKTFTGDAYFCCARYLEDNKMSVAKRLKCAYMCMYVCTKPPSASYTHAHILVYFPTDMAGSSQNPYIEGALCTHA